MIKDQNKSIDGVDEGEELGPLVSKFMQKDSFNAFERIICSHLIEAISGDQLDNVIHICRAALCLDAERMENLELDFEEIKGIYTVAQRISSATTRTFEKTGQQMISVIFGTLDWEKHIVPWALWEHYNSYAPTLPKVFNLEDHSPSEIFFSTSRRLSPAGYEHLKSDFLLYVIDKTQEYTRKLSALVSPATYQEVLSIFKASQVGVKQ